MLDELEIAALMATCDPDHLARDLARRIASVGLVRQKLEKLAQERAQAEANFRATLDRLDREKLAVQHQCFHPRLVRVTDPSGGNDSHDECAICGAKIAPRN